MYYNVYIITHTHFMTLTNKTYLIIINKIKYVFNFILNKNDI